MRLSGLIWTDRFKDDSSMNCGQHNFTVLGKERTFTSKYHTSLGTARGLRVLLSIHGLVGMSLYQLGLVENHGLSNPTSHNEFAEDEHKPMRFARLLCMSTVF